MWGGKVVRVSTSACRLQQWVPDPLEQPDVGAGSGPCSELLRHFFRPLLFLFQFFFVINFIPGKFWICKAVTQNLTLTETG